MKQKSVIGLIAVILLIIGGLNWGLVGLFQWDLVAAIFGIGSIISNIIYVLVGLAALVKLVMILMPKSDKK